MNSDQTWDAIFARLDENIVQLKTKSGFWFTAYVKKGKLYINGATDYSPACDIKRPRPISEKEFTDVFSYYDRWANGTTGIRQIISQKSMSAAYIFALIDLVKK